MSEFDVAQQLLSRPFSITGRVVHGDKMGRQLGVPTANVLLRRLHSPVNGVYAVTLTGVTDDVTNYSGVANVGTRPTVHGEQSRLEVHVLDFDGSLYGRRLQVVFRHKIRDERKFANFDALAVAIKEDINTARRYFAS